MATPDEKDKTVIRDNTTIKPKMKSKADEGAGPAVSKLVAMKDSPSGLRDRDAILAAVVDAVIEMGGAGEATAEPATEIEKSS